MNISNEENLYCKIFVDGSIARHDLIAMLASELGGVAKGYTVMGLRT